MKKNYKFGLGLAFSLLALAACSDSSVDSAEAVRENWPADFTVSEYSLVNKDLANFQRMAQVAEANQAYIAALGDSTKTISFEDSSELAIFFDDSNAVKTFFVEYAGINAEYWPGMSALRDGMTDAEGNLNIDGQRAMEYRSVFGRFHTFGNTASQDIANLQAMPIDSAILEFHFVKAGKYEGRAYRFCKDGEARVPKYIEVRSVENVEDTTVEYVYKDTLIIDTVPKNPPMYLVKKDGSDVTDTVPAQSLGKMEEEGVKYDLLDSITYTIKEKQDSIKIDSTVTYGSHRVTTITKVPSPEANAVDANEGSPLEGRVWNFSAELFCKNPDDGIIYLIENP